MIIDFFKFSRDYAPPNKRGEKSLAWYKSLLKPLQTINEYFYNIYFVDVKLRAKRNAQKIVLEKTLNEVFGTGTSIFIDNTGDNLETIFFYNSFEGYPPIFFDDFVYLYNILEYSKNRLFIVYVPKNVLNLAQLKAEVEKYRVAGTIYEVIEYE